MTVIFSIHPAVRSGKHPVTRTYTRGKKSVTCLMAWIDPPGTYWDEEWNVHVDGCDYPHLSMEECRKRIADFYRTGADEIQFKETDEPYIF